jgi:hypothetical protein
VRILWCLLHHKLRVGLPLGRASRRQLSHILRLARKRRILPRAGGRPTACSPPAATPVTKNRLPRVQRDCRGCWRDYADLRHLVRIFSHRADFVPQRPGTRVENSSPIRNRHGAMRNDPDLMIATLSWLLLLGLIAAIIGDAFR